MSVIFEHVDLDAERSFLRYMALNDFSVGLDVNSEWFYGQGERIVFKILKQLRSHFPVKTLKRVILDQAGTNKKTVEESIDAIIKSESLKTPNSVKAVLKVIQNNYVCRSILTACEQAIELVEEQDVSQATSVLSGVLHQTNTKIRVSEYLETAEQRQQLIKERAKSIDNNKSDIIPTGIREFDKQAGGLKKGEVGFLVAETGGGKSLGKLNFATVAWLLGYNVIFLGLEMVVTENQLRADSLLTQIPSRDFRLGKLMKRDYEDWSELIKQYRRDQKNYYEFVSAKNLTMDEIYSIVDSIQAKRGSKCDLFILDHIYLVKGKNTRLDERIQLKESVDSLTEWALENDIGVWTSSQVTDAGINRKGGYQVNDIKYARALSEWAQIVLSFHQSEIDKVSGEGQVGVIKGRSIPKGTTYVVRPDFSRMVLDSVSFLDINVRLAKFIKTGKNKPKKVGKL
jgi:replicative DNA helicase